MLVAFRGNVTLVLATGTSLPPLLPFWCALSKISYCVAFCYVHLTVFLGQDLGDDTFARLGPPSSVSEYCLKHVPRFRQFDSDCAGKKLVQNQKANISKLACDCHDVCDLWFHGVRVIEGDGE